MYYKNLQSNMTNIVSMKVNFHNQALIFILVSFNLFTN